MNYSYKIHNFHAGEGSIGVIYTNTDDAGLETRFKRMFISNSMSENDIKALIENNAPISEWEDETVRRTEDSSVVEAMIGVVTPTTFAVPAVDAPTALLTRLNALDAAYAAALFAGVSYNSHTFGTLPEDQNNLMGTAATIANSIALPVDFKWTAKDGNGDVVEVAMDAADMVALSELVFNHVNACFVNRRVHKAAVDAAPDAATLEAYDVSTGWPA